MLPTLPAAIPLPNSGARRSADGYGYPARLGLGFHPDDGRSLCNIERSDASSPEALVTIGKIYNSSIAGHWIMSIPAMLS